MNRYNPKAIGAFVLGAIAMAVVAVVVLASGRLFRKEYKYVLCFPGDLSGLHVGAAVKFRGVPIGSVTAIRLNLRNMPPLLTSSSEESRIPVIIELDETQIILRGGRVNLTDPRTLEEAIRKGLRGQLRLESFVTGVSYVSLDIVPKAPLVLCLPAGSGYQEIPTVTTTLEQAQSTLQRLIAKMEEADVGEMMTTASSAMKGIDQLVSSPGLHAAINSLDGTERNLSIAAQNFSRAAASMRVLADNLNSRVPPLMTTLQGTSERAEGTMNATDQTLAAVRVTAEPNSPLIYRMNHTLDNVSDAAHSIQELADYLKRNPGALIRGRYQP
jgi:phospholipid/cholesterol/gamma-HCH transport system substrate-binding protein